MPNPGKIIQEPWFELEGEIVADAPQYRNGVFYQVNEPNGALICAFTDKNEIVLVRQFRPAVEHLVLDFPAGGVDPGESPLVAAVRELWEETGYACRELQYAGVGWTAVERIDTAVFIFFGRGAVKDPDHNPEAGVEVITVPVEKLKAMFLSGELRTYYGLGALTLIKWKLNPPELESL